MILKELCIGSIDDVKMNLNKLEEFDRYETCSNLNIGGLTPTIETFLFIKEKSKNKPQVVMIRNKNTFLIQDENDIRIMCEQIENLARLGARDFIFGYITDDNEIDIENCKKLINKINEYPNTTYSFHMAIDLVNDYKKSIEKLIKLGFKRVLLKGGKLPAINNLINLKKLQELFNNKIELIVGGGVNKNNFKEITNFTKIKQVHGRKIV